MLRLRLLQLLRVHNQSLLHSYLSIVVQVARRRVSSLSADKQLLLSSFALLELLFDLELGSHEGLADLVKTNLFAPESSLLQALLLDDLSFNLPFGHFF